MKFKNKLFCNENIDCYFCKDDRRHKIVSTNTIVSGETIEECALYSDHVGDIDVTLNNTFPWPKGADNPICKVLPAGFGGLISRTSNVEKVNVDWECDFNFNIINIFAIKDIDKDTELFIHDPYIDPNLQDMSVYEEQLEYMRRIRNNIDYMISTMDDNEPNKK